MSSSSDFPKSVGLNDSAAMLVNLMRCLRSSRRRRATSRLQSGQSPSWNSSITQLALGGVSFRGVFIEPRFPVGLEEVRWVTPLASHS